MSNQLQWIVARLGDDYNWWVESTSVPTGTPPGLSSILDPRQVAHLREILVEYRQYGLTQQQWARAFTFFTLQSEIAEGQVRLVPADDETAEVFALPVIDPEGESPYSDFLDAVVSARVRKLNATHGYLTDCTADELTTELEMLDVDRYFSDESRHCFDELNEILEWEPAEWEDPSES
ncbi:MAG: hypothetical protein PCFJNLEI_02296 [Verrucomicrobiae bacterium]|nr:hypothetical protein [Verrucomicrobiae bacterium]